jgi:hypothetical protein
MGLADVLVTKRGCLYCELFAFSTQLRALRSFSRAGDGRWGDEKGILSGEGGG